MNLYAWKFFLFSGEPDDYILIYTTTQEPIAEEDIIYKENGTPYTDGELRIPGEDMGFDSDIVMSNVIYGYGTLDEEDYIEISGEVNYDGGSSNLTFNCYRSSEDDILEKLISKISHKGQTYTIKDAQARQEIENLIPSQEGQAGKVLTTNGATMSWSNPTSPIPESIQNQNNERITPVKVWTGSEAQFKQASFENWQSVTAQASVSAFSNCYGNGMFLMMPGWGVQQNNYSYSYDGETWYNGTFSLTNVWRLRGKWVHDRFVSLCNNGQYEYSFDGINWVPGTFPLTNVHTWDITYGNGKFVIIYDNATNINNPINKAYYSTDFIHWTESTMYSGSTDYEWAYWRLITFFKGKFIAFRTNTTLVAYSMDAITWNTTNINLIPGIEVDPNPYWTADNGEICVAQANGRDLYYASTDGITWNQRQLPDSYRHHVIYDGVRFVLMPDGDTNKVLISTDGLNWEYSDKTVAVGSYMAVAYGQNKVVAMNNGTTNIIVQNYVPVNVSNPEYLSFVENKKILLGNDEIINMNTKQDKNLIFTNVSASTWVSDNTLQDYGYKCEITCSGVNENMFAQVVFGIEEANSGNYASVCDTAENKVIIYSKVNNTITIPTIVVMEA